MPATRRLLRAGLAPFFSLEKPLARPQIEERELRGAKQRLSQARMTDFLQMLMIILQGDSVPVV
ncbi:hypothetical protein KSX_52830 [Ktedonospora formicarum]|uniref:Uncharacterized protein n=1 Tax=Ktedonospora formicarum TaxID=2778364 RepID=A0A8J3MW32_9CHLR|nr:hypothetical protein KSX_52830 [Ktedonospora formicarum]